MVEKTKIDIIKNKREETVGEEIQSPIIAGMSQKMKTLLSRDTTIDEKLRGLEREEEIQENCIETNMKIENRIEQKLTREKRITRSQSKQLVNKEVSNYKGAKEKNIEDESILSVGISQRMEEIGELCGFKKSKGIRKKKEKGVKRGNQ